MCRICKGLGYIIENDIAKKCICLKKSQQKTRIQKIIDQSDLPQTILNYKVLDYIGDDKNNNIVKIKKYINEFSDIYNKRHLYFYGRGSTQKTTLMSYIGREIALKGYNVKFILMDKLIKLLQDNFNEESRMRGDKYLNCDLLLIDDSFDNKKVTLYKSGYQLTFLDSFLRERLEGLRLATIFTSNINIDDIAEQGFEQSIQDLMKRNVYEMQFNDSVTISFNIDNMFEE